MARRSTVETRWALLCAAAAIAAAACGEDTAILAIPGEEVSAAADADARVAVDAGSDQLGADLAAADASADATGFDVATADVDAKGDGGGGKVCKSVADCPKAGTCQAATCLNGKCSTAHLADGAACDDGNVCSSGDACKGGVCLPGGAQGCDDKSPCTVDTCDAQKGCQHAPLDASCEDGNPCTTGDGCQGGVCLPGAVSPCDDGNPCTTDGCDKFSGCTAKPNGAPCSDGSACTSADTCEDGSCKGGLSVACVDSSPCTTDGCEAGKGCVFTPKLGDCVDGSVCTVNDTCKDGLCLPGPPAPCDDGNACTADACDYKTGCSNTINDSGCSDGNACTTADVCKAGKCVGQKPVDCDDGNPCTTDGCGAAKGCAHDNNTLPCTDNNACTSGDTCLGGACAPGAAVGCDDGNPCSDDSCVAASGCAHVANKVPCSDGSACTVDDACQNGSCAPGIGLACADGNACTDDVCNKATGCAFVFNNLLCDDSNACTQADSCQAGNCVSGAPPACDDKNPCTTETCDPGQGCKNVPHSGPCDDGNACTTADQCVNANCAPGKVLSCSDGNACTDDACDPGKGCTAKANSAPCSDGNACTKGEVCKAGVCGAGGQVVCDDKNGCTLDLCDPTKGCQTVNVAVACSDGNPCTHNDLCKAGACVPGPAIACNDGNPCTDDACGTNGQCTTLPNAATCTDGNACTSGDVCASGTCAGKTAACDDGNPCTTDYCDAAKGCQAIANALPCSDGSACTTGDVCLSGTCGGTAIVCSDGNPCTFDACNPALGCTAAPVADGQQCGGSGICQAGVCSPGSLINPAPNCQAILSALGKAASDGVYWLDGDGSGAEPPFQTACDMTSAGGGWTLALRSNGATANFVYDSPLWNTKLAFNADKASQDAVEAKFASFWTVPFSQVRVVLKTGAASHAAVISHKAKSLYDVFADGVYKAWTPALGRAAWKALIPKASLQASCNREGFNNAVKAPWAAVRIGIIANEQADCATPDSRLGIGMAGSVCGLDPLSSTGNGAGCGGDAGDLNIKSLGWVWVR